MDWAALAYRQHGVISRVQLRASGVDDSAIAGLIGRGEVTRVCRGVFLVRGAPLTYRARLHTSTLASGGVLARATASHLWGMTEVEPDIVDVIVSPQRRPRSAIPARVHRQFVPASAIVFRDGLSITNRAWTALDQLGCLPETDAYRLADRALQRSWLTRADIAGRLREFPGRPGNQRLTQIHRRSADGAASTAERMLHRILRQAGVTGWHANYALWHNGELIAVIDVALPDHRLAIEADGWAYHSAPDRFQGDRDRQNALVGLGWRVLRFTWTDVTQRPEHVARTIQRHLP